MNLADARVILTDLLQKRVLDSLLLTYKKNDSLKDVSISIQYEKIKDLIEKNNNEIFINNNNQVIINNKDSEIVLLNKTIKEQKSEILKQKVLKIIGFTTSVVLPIVVLILLH